MRRRRRRAYRKSIYDYILPFIIITAVISLLFLIFRGNSGWLTAGTSEAHFYIETGSAEVKLDQNANWNNALDGVRLFRGESVRTNIGSRAKLVFLDNSEMRIDERTTITIDSLSKGGDDRNNHIKLEDGNVWSYVQYTANDATESIVSTPLMNVESRGGTFAVGTNSVRVFDGIVNVNLLYEDEEIHTVTAGIGQKVEVNEEMIEKVSRREGVKLLTAIDDDFKKTGWYKWNTMKDSTSQTEDSNSDDEYTLENEGESEPEEIEEVPADSFETEEPPVVGVEDLQILQPQFEDGELNTTESEILFEGIAAEDIESISVNGYTLQKYIAGSGKWAYTASTRYNNLAEGVNEFTIIGTYQDGAKTKAVEVIVNYDENGEFDSDEEEVVEDQDDEDLENDEAAEDDDESEDEEFVITRTDSITLDITSHSDGQEVTTSAFDLTGSAPKEAKFIEVNDYRLQGYSPSDKTWLYKANVKFGNLKEGENIYTVEAFDKDNTRIDFVEIEITYTPEESEDLSEEESVDEEETSSSENSDSETGEEPNSNSSTSNTNEDQETSNEVSEENNDVNSVSSDPQEVEAIESVEAEPTPEALFTAPTITFPSPSGTFTTSLRSLNIGGTASARSVEVLVNNEPISYVSGDTSWKHTVNLSVGENTFVISAKDENGNVSSSSQIIIIVEQQDS